MSKKNKTLIQRFKNKNPKIYEFFKVASALSILGGVVAPTFMWAENNKVTNIHSAQQIEAFHDLEELKQRSPLLYKALQTEFNVNIENCISELEVLDMHNSNYYKCKKIANKVKTHLEALK